MFETKVAEANLNTNDFRGHCNVKLKLVSHPMITKCFRFFAQLDSLLVVNLLLIANLASTISKSVQLLESLKFTDIFRFQNTRRRIMYGI